ncbi:hypothetical protein H4S06_002940 [Coemansia sp. BCRC 34490]|nr:hypothetical protein H4S06_002940 [Coemansia sp. BCRC 34490]
MVSTSDHYSPSNSKHTTSNPAQARLPSLSPEFLAKHYPSSVSLVHVDVLTRHGERTPVSNFFKKLSPPHWDFCKTGNHLHADFIKTVGLYTNASPATASADRQGQQQQWSNHLFRKESRSVKAVFGIDDKEKQQTGDKNGSASGQPSEATCGFGQLTDVGRQSMTALGQHLRHLYVESLGLLPTSAPRRENNHDGPTGDLYLRSTSFSRAFESLQHTLGGLYPAALDAQSLFRINVRPSTRDNLLANFGCKNMVRLYKEFNIKAKEAALDEYNALYDDLLKLDGLRESYESRPKNVNIPMAILAWDTLASMRAHSIPLPSAIDDRLIERVAEMSSVEYLRSTWQSASLARLQIGSLAHELVANIVRSVELDRGTTPSNNNNSFHNNRWKMGIYSGHDTTISPLLAVFGTALANSEHDNAANNNNNSSNTAAWPPYGSSIRIELLKDDTTQRPAVRPAWEDDQAYHSEDLSMVPFDSRIRPINVPDSLYHWPPAKRGQSRNGGSDSDARFNPRATRDYYVRVWYNDRELQLPACLDPGAHHATLGTTTCTLDGFFKQIARFVPSEEESARGCNLPATGAAESQKS